MSVGLLEIMCTFNICPLMWTLSLQFIKFATLFHESLSLGANYDWSNNLSGQLSCGAYAMEQWPGARHLSAVAVGRANILNSNSSVSANCSESQSGIRNWFPNNSYLSFPYEYQLTLFHGAALSRGRGARGFNQ